MIPDKEGGWMISVSVQTEGYTPVNIVRVAACIAALILSMVRAAPGDSLSAPFALGAVILALLWFFLEQAHIVSTPENPYLAFMPTVLDVLVISYFVVHTGGVYSPVIVLYYFIILVSSLNVRIRHGLFTAAISMVSFAGVALTAAMPGWHPGQFFGGPKVSDTAMLVLSIALNGAGFFLVNRLTEFQMKHASMLINKLENSEKALTRQNSIVQLLLRDFQNQSTDWLFEVDRNLRITYISGRVLARLNEDSVVGVSVVDLLRSLAPAGDELAARSIEDLVDALSSSVPFRDLEILINLRGQEFWLEFSATPLEDDNGFAGWRGVGKNISSRKELELKLHRKAYLDERTGLPNRYQFNKLLDTNLAAASEKQTGVLGIIKLDNLDTLRINMSSAASDALIRAFVAAAADNLGPSFLLCRLEYDEFGFWSVDSSLDALDRIHGFSRAMRNPLALGTESFLLEVRVGIAFFPEDGSDRSSLLRAADLALNSTQSFAGRNVTRYSEKYSSLAIRRAELTRDFPAALESGQFFMMYQPQVDAVSGVLEGSEALVRWNHPVKGLVSPAEFIPLAEQSGYITALDDWVLKQSCTDAMTWSEPLSVSINVSGIHLRQPRQLGKTIEDALATSGLPPDRMMLELTESSLLTSGQDANELFSLLRASGVKIALDDFGTGYSSMSYLQELALDELKVDQSFVRNLQHGTRAEAIVQAIIRLADSLGLVTVAEGVETRDQADVLRSLGCRTFQGYLYGKPMPNKEFLAKIACPA